MDKAKTNTPEQHLFGRWRFNYSTGELSDGETSKHLEPQVGRLLDYFLTHQNVLTSRDDLIASVWDQRIVSDDAINRCVSILRNSLSPDDKNSYIETVVRRGFISHFPPAPSEKSPKTELTGRKNYTLIALLCVLAVLLLYVVYTKSVGSKTQVQAPQHNERPMVAVLPFSSSGFVGDSTFIANGIHDDLLTQLAQLQSIRVISRTSVLEYRGTTHNILDIGRELGVDAILEGSIQRIGDQLRINVQLIDAHSDGHLWAEQYDRQFTPTNIFAVQTEISRSIASALNTTLSQQDKQQLNILPTENLAAYTAYHQAMEIRNFNGIDTAPYVAALEQAVTLDPGFGRAWAELVGALSLNDFGEQDPEVITQIQKILTKIQVIAPKSADYLIAQAYYTYYILKNYQQAYQLIKSAQKLRPSDSRILELKSWIERRLGNFDAKIRSIRAARELDPKNPAWTINLVASLLINHQYQEASEVIENSVIKTLRLAVLGSILQLKDFQGLQSWVARLTAIEKEYGAGINPDTLWEANIASRNYPAALKVLAKLDSAAQISGEWKINPNWTHTIRAANQDRPNLEWLMTYWFLGADEQVKQSIAQGQAQLDAQRDSEGKFLNNNKNLVMAFLTAISGDRLETERLVRVWHRGALNDLAEYSGLQAKACRALGLAAATRAAVQCIRTGLSEPSQVIPFIEPYLPYYDAIREQPEFAALLTEIQQPSRAPF